MGWCYEFGAQICEGCGAPMIASSSSCTCDQCGTVCTGRFSSCRDVWARGPQPFTVVAPPQVPAPGTPSSTPASVAGNGHAHLQAGADLDSTADPTPLPFPPSRPPAGTSTLAEIESRLGAVEAVSAYVQALRRALRKELERFTAESKERDRLLAEARDRIGALESRVASLQTLPARVDSLSREVFEARRAGSTETEQRLSTVETRLDSLAALRARVTTVETTLQRLDSLEALDQRIRALEERATGAPAFSAQPGPPDA
jgi:BMFP domain-containing protein YqiC